MTGTTGLATLAARGLVAPDWAEALAPVDGQITAMGEFLRADLALAARRRVSTELDWRPQARSYVGVFDDLTDHPRPLLDGGDLTAPVTEDPTRRYVDLADEAELRRFVLERTAQVPLP